jgi:hypothetical protein
MPLPDRPVASTTIDSDWGQAVHDWTFAPKGCDLTTVTTRTVDTTNGGLKCHLDVATDDPAGFLDAANDRAIVPAGADGLYLISLILNSVNGTAGDITRAYIYVNGVGAIHSIEDNNGGTNIRVNVTTLIALTAGDILEVYAMKRGSGTNPTVYVVALRLLRMGNEYGA